METLHILTLNPLHHENVLSVNIPRELGRFYHPIRSAESSVTKIKLACLEGWDIWLGI